MRVWTSGPLLVLLSVLEAGCGGGAETRSPPPAVQPLPEDEDGIRCLFDAEDVKRWTPGLGSAFAVAKDGDLLIQGADNIFDTGTGTAICGEPFARSFHFAADREGTVYTIDGRTFGIVIAGAVTKLTELPEEGFRVTVASADRLYLYGPSPDGKAVVYLLTRNREGKTMVQQFLTLSGKIAALAPYGADLLLVQGNSLYQAGLRRDGKVGAVLLADLTAGRPILSLAADGARRLAFVSTSEETYCLGPGGFVPILAFGGELSLSGEVNEKLFVYQPSEKRAFEVNLPRLFARLAAQPTER